jgi:hypothetical protein
MTPENNDQEDVIFQSTISSLVSSYVNSTFVCEDMLDFYTKKYKGKQFTLTESKITGFLDVIVKETVNCHEVFVLIRKFPISVKAFEHLVQAEKIIVGDSALTMIENMDDSR